MSSLEGQRPESARPKTRRAGRSTAGSSSKATVIHQKAPQKRKPRRQHATYSELLIRIAPTCPAEAICIAGIIVATVYYIATKDQWLLLTFLGAAAIQGMKDLAHVGIKHLGKKQTEE